MSINNQMLFDLWHITFIAFSSIEIQKIEFFSLIFLHGKE